MKLLFAIPGTNVAREPHHAVCLAPEKVKMLDWEPSPGFPRKVERCDGKRRPTIPCSKGNNHGAATWVVTAKFGSGLLERCVWPVCDDCLEPTREAFRHRGAPLIEEEPAELVCFTCEKSFKTGEPYFAIAVSG